MECQEALECLEQDADEALGASGSRTLNAHLAECAGCHAAREHLHALRSAVRARATYFSAPASLRQRVGNRLEQDTPLPIRRIVLPAWAFAGALAGVAVLAVALTLTLGAPSRRDQLAQEVVASHVRSLMENHLADVASSDQHTVKPWFSGRLDYSPPVRDLASEGFPLVGARMDYVDQRPVAALVYQRQRHRINVFVWPTARAPTVAGSANIKGYNAIEWTHAGMAFWAVSDLNGQELARLKDLLSESGG
jgi:anti-sigma factor RsiW